MMYTQLLICLGLFGILSSKSNIIIIFVEIELMLLSANFNFIVFSLWLDDAVGYL